MDLVVPVTQPADSGDDLVALPRRDVRSLYRAVLAFLAVIAVAVLPLAIVLLRQDSTNDHLDSTDERLEALIASEQLEDEQEDADACVNSHVRYDQFLVLAERLTEAGATVGTDAHLSLLGATEEEAHRAHALIEELLPAQVQPIIEDYPPPGCDLTGSLELLAEHGPPDTGVTGPDTPGTPR